MGWWGGFQVATMSNSNTSCFRVTSGFDNIYLTIPDIYTMLHKLSIQLPDHSLGIQQLCLETTIYCNTEVSLAVLSLYSEITLNYYYTFCIL